MTGFLGGGFKYFYFRLYLGKISNLTNIFQMGWKDQLVFVVGFKQVTHLQWKHTCFVKVFEKIIIIFFKQRQAWYEHVYLYAHTH